jgi:hypothetical protein
MRRTPWILGLVLCLLIPTASAAPTSVNFQGLLLGSGGAPFNGTLSFEFRLFAAASGGASLWTETQPTVSVVDGVYSVQLGSVTPFPASLFSGADRYLEVVAGGEVMAPRQKLLSVPFALNAQRLGSLDSLNGTLCNSANPLAGNVVVTYALNGAVTLSCGNSYTLTVTRTIGNPAPPAVSSSPAGISCGADCSEVYVGGTVVTLTTSSTGLWTFTGWSGACTGTGSCVVTMDANKSVMANYFQNL